MGYVKNKALVTTFQDSTTCKNNTSTPIPYFICIRNGIHMKRGINDEEEKKQNSAS